MFHKINMEWQQKAISWEKKASSWRNIHAKITHVEESLYITLALWPYMRKNLKEFVNIIIFIMWYAISYPITKKLKMFLGSKLANLVPVHLAREKQYFAYKCEKWRAILIAIQIV